MHPKSSKYVEFEGFRLGTDQGGDLSFNGEPVHLQPKALELLRELVLANGETVTREQLMTEVWREAFVEDGNINFTVSCVRKALRDAKGDDTEFIRTVPKVGYRFIAEIQETERPSEATADRPSVVPKRAFSRKRAFVLMGFISLFFFTSFGVWWQLDRGIGISPVPLSERDFETLAVLPPISLDESGQDTLIGLAVADSVAAELGRLNFIAVRSVQTSKAFGNTGENEIEFARRLGVDAVLSSTYVQEGRTIRFRFKLQDARDRAVVWTGNVDVSSGGLLQLQDVVSYRVTNEIARAFNLRSGSPRQARPTDNDEAYQAYLRGKYRVEQRTGDEIEPLNSFRRAVELDANFAEAYVGIADSLSFLEPPQPEMERAIEKAVELDPQLADAWATRGFVRMFHHWDWEEAERSFRRAVALQPYNSKARHWYATHQLLRGEFDRAEEELQKALDLNPSSVFIRSDIAMLHYYKGDLDLAQKEAEVMKELAPDAKEAFSVLSRVAFARGDDENGIRLMLRYAEVSSDIKTEMLQELEFGGKEAFAQKWIDHLRCDKSGPSLTLQCVEYFLLRGERESALAYLEAAADRRMFLLPFVLIDPFFDQIRDEPAYERIVGAMGLERPLDSAIAAS